MAKKLEHLIIILYSLLLHFFTGISYIKQVSCNTRFTTYYTHCLPTAHIQTQTYYMCTHTPPKTDTHPIHTVHCKRHTGPLPKTLVDFWRLVWQERPPSIVMITNLEEGGKIKCQRYWPESGRCQYGPFEVTLTDEQIMTDYTIRKLGAQVSSLSKQTCHD